MAVDSDPEIARLQRIWQSITPANLAPLGRINEHLVGRGVTTATRKAKK